MTIAAQSWERREATSFFHTFTDLPSLKADGPVIIDHGDGPYIVDTAGRRYFEGNSGLWNMTLGFSEQRLSDAAVKQYREFPGYHTFFGRNTKPTVELAERMLALAPVAMSRVFFTNSGSEANESIVKLLWMMWAAEGKPERRKLLTRKNAYHGATVMASALTGKDYVKAFGLPGPEIITLDCPHAWRFALPGESDEEFAARLAANLESRILQEGPETIAGIFAEPVMGAGGVIVPPATYFARIQPVLKKYGIPLIADEVICGFGRTGSLWGAEAVGQEPDIIVASKSMSAGYFPMGTGEATVRPETGSDKETLSAIEALMAAKRVYRDVDLNLDRLARKLGIPARQISTAINRATGKNVSQYVNEHRIAEACALLVETDKPVTEIMFEVLQTASNLSREFCRLVEKSLEWRELNDVPSPIAVEHDP
jgi:adenosylmethionine-8-amino-7-oxononanoate aminotransferase